MITPAQLLDALLPRWYSALTPDLQGALRPFENEHRVTLEASLRGLVSRLVDPQEREKAKRAADVARMLQAHESDAGALLNAWRAVARQQDELGADGAAALKQPKALRAMSANALELSALAAAYEQLTGKHPHAAEVPASTPALLADDVPTHLQEYYTYPKKLRRGGVTVEEYKATFERFRRDEPAIRAWAARQRVVLLRRLVSGRARGIPALVDMLIDGIAKGFEVNTDRSIINIMSFRRDPRPTIEKVADAVATTTQADLDAVAADTARSAARDDEWEREQAARRARALAPVTLDDFHLALRERGLRSLTPDELERYDALKAAADFEAQKRRVMTVEAADLPGTRWEIVDSFHTKQQVPIYVVKRIDDGERLPRDIFDDLNVKARALSGKYSGYRKDGAIPGFVFFARANAEAFLKVASGEGDVSNADAVAGSEAYHQGRRAQRLEQKAEVIVDRADDALSADRETNTRKRLQDARSAEAAARREKRIGLSLEAIATRIAAGEARYLSRIGTRSQLEALDAVLVRAKYARPEDEPDRDGPPRMTDIPRAVYPWPTLHVNRIPDIAAAAKRTPGAKMAGRRLEGLRPSNNYVTFKTSGELDLLKQLGNRLGGHNGQRLREAMADYERLQRSGITTDAVLREALREYLQCCRGAPIVADPIVELERDVVRLDIPGFYPTPPDLADTIVAKANLRPGMRVLEPSAGIGSIAEAILRKEPGVELSVIELRTSLREILTGKGFNLVGSDFLEHAGQSYDAIIMNPPFEEDQDINHVRHAYSLLAPGGVLVSIMWPGAFVSENTHSRLRREFREWFDAIGGRWAKNPDGAFLSSARPTGIATVTVEIRKPAVSRPAKGHTIHAGNSVITTRLEPLELTEAAPRLRRGWAGAR